MLENWSTYISIRTNLHLIQDLEKGSEIQIYSSPPFVLWSFRQCH
jgi:hypothetical protein